MQRLGQSHAIARFLARSHELMGSTPEEAAAVDLLYECVRDIKTRWFRVKATKDAPDNDGEAGAARRDAKRRWWTSQMPEACEQLEGALLAASPASESPWLVGDALSLAEIDKAVRELWPEFDHKPALMRACAPSPIPAMVTLHKVPAPVR